MTSLEQTIEAFILHCNRVGMTLDIARQQLAANQSIPEEMLAPIPMILQEMGASMGNAISLHPNFRNQYLTPKQLTIFDELADPLSYFPPLNVNRLAHINRLADLHRKAQSLIPETLGRHTGSRTEMQKMELDGIDNLIAMGKRDLERWQDNLHPLLWLIVIWLTVRFAIISKWDLSWFDMVNIIYLIPLSFFLYSKVDIFSSKLIDLAYPTEESSYSTFTHIYERGIEERKRMVEEINSAVERHRKRNKIGATVWIFCSVITAFVSILGALL